MSALPPEMWPLVVNPEHENRILDRLPATQVSAPSLEFIQHVSIRLRLPNTGTFVVWGKVAVANTATTAQAGIVQMTTLDGGTSLDTAEFSVGAASGLNIVSVSLQSTLDLSQPNTNEIVDIRCGIASGTATFSSLIAIPVDALSGPVGPGS